MEKIINIGEKKVKFKTSGAFALTYKAQFKRDPIADVMKLFKGINNIQKVEEEFNYENIDMEVFFNMTWVLAKTADKNIKAPLEWFEEFDSFPIMEVLPEILELIGVSFGTSVKSKKN